MNRQPYQTPPQWWAPKMNPWVVRWWRGNINRTLRTQQRITRIEVQGAEHVQQAIAGNQGILITPNHSFHYDSYVLIEAAHRVGRPFHFLTAWQVFQMGSPLERWVLQTHGCYSINREANDLQAFKQSVELLRESPYPLVIFPEGDIYHHNDRVTPFREGAAAIAMSAAKKGPRSVVAIPCALKAYYVTDPTAELEQLMSRLEESIHWQPRTHYPLHERIYKFAEAMLALKEIEHRGEPQEGTVTQRVARLADSILSELEREHALQDRNASIPERVKELRKAVIKATEQPVTNSAAATRLGIHMEQLFFVMQLYSYPGDYVAERPSLERIAETLDKFEEDVLRAPYPGVRGERHVVVKFGEPIAVAGGRESRGEVGRWTEQLQQRVQGLLDDINAQATGSLAHA